MMYGIGLRINMFFFKKNKITVDAFTKISGICEMFPIRPAAEFLPQWWKNLPAQYSTQDQNGLDITRSTLKRCDGFTSLYRAGFVLPMWVDTIIKTTNDGKWAYRLASNDTQTMIDSHPSSEFGNSFNSWIHMKIHSPWLLKEKSGCRFHYSAPIWNQIESLDNYYTPPGIINFQHQFSTHINLLFPKKDTQLTISAGTPMAHIVPLTDTTVEIKCHAVTTEEYNQIYLKNYVGSFLGSYKKNKKNRVAAGKCPMGV
jgi:hypothetical protein